MMRLKIHTSNVRINEAYVLRLEKAIRVHAGPSRSLQLDNNGMLRLQNIAKTESHDKSFSVSYNAPSDITCITTSEVCEDGNTEKLEKSEKLSMAEEQQ